MPIWDRFLKGTKRFRGAFASSPWAEAPDRDTRGFLEAYGRIYSLFGICLRRATAISEVKWRLYKVAQNGNRTLIPNHPILTLLEFVNEFQTGQELIELHQLHSDLAGKAFWYVPKNKLGVPGEIWLLPPDKMRIVPSQKDFIKGYILNVGNEKIPFTKDEIIWFPMPDPLNPYGGVGYAQAAAIELDSEDYAGRWNRNFFYNSARADAVLEYEDKLSDEEFERLREQWKSKYGGISKAHKIAILEGGVKYRQIQVSQKDMDFPELRKQTKENLMFTFGMHLSVMGISENVNRANAEAGDYLFARWSIKPALSRVRNKLNEQLVPMFKTESKLELDYDEVVPETTEQKRALAESGIKAGYLTVNNARTLTGWDPIPTGDQLLLPMNLFPTPITGAKAFTKSFTEEHKEAWWRSYIAKTETQERSFKQILKDLFDKQASEVVGKLRGAVKPDDALFDEDEAIKVFNKAFKPLVTDVFEDAVEGAMKQEFPLDAVALEWIAKRSLSLAKMVNGTTKEQLRAVLAAGFAEGESVPKLTKRVKEFYKKGYEWRAPIVARTEVIAASNEGALWRYEQEGVEKSEFYAALDERTCEECMALHGNVYPTREAHGLIPVHANCRCVFIPVV